MPRIFISFASVSMDIAVELYDALTERGATVFQFQQTAKPGGEAWGQVYENIQNADYFICLLCREAIKSAPVKKEIGFADHRNTNHKGKPALVPVLLENLDSAKWPAPLRVLTPIDIADTYGPGSIPACAARIADALGLEEQKAPDPIVQENSAVRERLKPAEMAEPPAAFAAAPAISGSVAGSAAPSDAEVIELLESNLDGFAWEKLIYAIAVLVLGAGLAFGGMVGAFIGLEFVNDNFYSSTSVPTQPTFLENYFDWVFPFLDWIAVTTWFHWLTIVIVAGLIVVWTWTTAEEEFPVELLDYLLIAGKSAFFAFLFSSVGALLHIWATDIEGLTLYVGAGMALSVLTTVVYVAFDD